MHHILDVRGLADLDDGRIDFPERRQIMGESQTQDPENPLAQYSAKELLRLLVQLSPAPEVERELHRRFGGRTVTVPVRLLEAWRKQHTALLL